MKIGIGIGIDKQSIFAEIPLSAPVNVGQPFLTGVGAVGVAVICNEGSWTGNPAPTYTYDFRLDSVSVQNGSSNSYTPLLADDGKTLTCLVTATNSQGSASEVTSNSLVIGIAPSNTIAPTLSPSGTQSTGTVITVGNGTFAGTAPLTYAYRWKRNGSIILGETANTYIIVAGDDGTVITAEVKATNAYGESEYIVTSNQVDAVNAIAPINTAAPVVSGTAVVGQTLSTTDGTWTGVPTPTYSYQWYRGATPIGTNSSSYTLVSADAGQNIKCTVTATNTAGSASADSNTLAIFDTIMDSQTDVYNAWSMVRLLRGAYYGSPIIRLRRTNDNAESDFGVGTNGLLNESAVTTWTGSNSATLVTMYAQDGSTRHLTNATPSEQPTFVNAGVIVKRTGAGSGAVARPSADFAGTQTLSVTSSTALYNFLHDGNNGWIYGVAEFGKVADPNVAYGLLGNAAASGSNRGFGIWYDDRSASGRNNTFNQDIYPAPVRNLGANGICAPQQLHIITAQFDADNATAAQRAGFAINGGALVRNNAITTAPNTAAASFNLQLGSWGNNGSRLVGYISEIIIFNADKSAADTSIRNNINAIYKTY